MFPIVLSSGSIAPTFNVDGTDTFVGQDGSLGSVTPYILGARENAGGLDLNRDAVKLQTVEANGLYRVLNEWNPISLPRRSSHDPRLAWLRQHLRNGDRAGRAPRSPRDI